MPLSLVIPANAPVIPIFPLRIQFNGAATKMSLDLDLIYSQFKFKMSKSNHYKIYKFEKFRLDAAHLMLYQGDVEISLPPKAIETLLVLVERRGEILGKDELIEAIWTDSIVEESNLAQYLYILRKILGETSGGKPFIETFRRRGYRFNGEVYVSDSAADFSPPRDEEKIENAAREDPDGQQLRFSNQRNYRVKRRGNVLALADWSEGEKSLAPEETVADRTDEGHLSAPASKLKFGTVFFVAALVFMLSGFSFVWFRLASTPKVSAVKGEMTFLNLTYGEDVNYATISPDEKYFVYFSHDAGTTRLWLQQVGQSNRLEIIPPFAGIIYGMTFTPDSQFLYLVINEKTDEPNVLYRIPVLGGVKTTILNDIVSFVSFSPDGQEMVFLRLTKDRKESSLVIASSDGTRERVLLTRAGNETIAGAGAAWSPDGKLIAFGALNLEMAGKGACTIVGIEPQGSELKTLSPEKWDNCYQMVWTSDAQGLVFIGTKAGETLTTRRDQVYYLSTDNGEARRLTTDGSRHQPGLGISKGDAIVVVPFNRASQIWAMDASGDSRTAVQITNGLADGRGGIAVLADGRVAYLTRAGEGFGVWLMNADGSNRKQLTDYPTAIEELRAAPDGSFFVFSAKPDRLNHIFRVDASGANLKQLTFGGDGGAEIDSTVSPDGNWVVYNSAIFINGHDKQTLWKIPSSGGTPVQLTETDSKTPHFSPDGKFISYISDEKIVVISAENGSPVKTFETVPNALLNIGARWTPDSQALTYVVYRKNAGNIWKQPINGGEPKPLTDFTSSDMYNFAFSQDGSRLYVARGYQIRNAVLIRNFK
jgi:Tol biopolymer transport system component/DNA-binding winged helix-turn-helix (wHTH) protein